MKLTFHKNQYSNDVIELLKLHKDFCDAETPICKRNRLSIDQMRQSQFVFFAARIDEELVAIGGFSPFSSTEAELKTMHVKKAFRGRGVADEFLRNIEIEAKRMGFTHLFLETGDTDNFVPAVKFYQREGYQHIDRFSHYSAENSGILMTKML